ERRAVQREHSEPEQCEEAMHVHGRRRLERAPERLRLQDKPGEDGSREQRICRETARAGEQPERRVRLHDVLVTTWAAGRFTTRTAGAAAGTACAAAADAAAAAAAARASTRAISARRAFNSTRYRAQRAATTFRTSFASRCSCAWRTASARRRGSALVAAHGCAATTAHARKNTTSTRAS